jgi:hypothetical protein
MSYKKSTDAYRISLSTLLAPVVSLLLGPFTVLFSSILKLCTTVIYLSFYPYRK